MNGTDFYALLTASLKSPSKKERTDIIKYLFPLSAAEVKDRYDAVKLTESLFMVSGNEIQNAADEAEKISECCMRRGIRVVSFFNPEYPPLLREIYSPPALLYVKGILPDPSRPSLAVVGTRSALRKTLTAAYEAASAAAGSRLSVVSGLASGIDTKAHEGTLDSGGYTAAVLGSGADVVYPSSNRGLADRILASGGSLISEYKPGTEPLKYHFPERNRIISGISRGTLIVHAPEKSGSLITASFALDQGRDVFVHKEGLEQISGIGGRLLCESGAQSVECGSDILKEWGIVCSSAEESSEYRFDNTVFNVKENGSGGSDINKNGLYNRRKLYA